MSQLDIFYAEFQDQPVTLLQKIWNAFKPECQNILSFIYIHKEDSRGLLECFLAINICFTNIQQIIKSIKMAKFMKIVKKISAKIK